jgi:predicted nuclease with TOPRIM domain
MASTSAEDASRGEQMSSSPPVTDLVGWVREGEHLFGAALQALQQCDLLRERADRLEQENWRLGEEMRIISAELERLRADRVEAAESLKAIAEHVTRLATAALWRLGKPVA